MTQLRFPHKKISSNRKSVLVLKHFSASSIFANWSAQLSKPYNRARSFALQNKR